MALIVANPIYQRRLKVTTQMRDCCQGLSINSTHNQETEDMFIIENSNRTYFVNKSKVKHI